MEGLSRTSATKMPVQFRWGGGELQQASKHWTTGESSAVQSALVLLWSHLYTLLSYALYFPSHRIMTRTVHRSNFGMWRYVSWFVRFSLPFSSSWVKRPPLCNI